MDATLSDAAIAYLVNQYNLAGAECVRVDGDSVICTGRMPNTNEDGEFFAGYVADVERSAKLDPPLAPATSQD